MDATYERIADSVKKLGGDSGYVDLFLIHTASGGSDGRKTMWLALERALKEGKCKAIGVSNWGVRHVDEMKGYAKVWPPAVNQIEVGLILLLAMTDIMPDLLHPAQKKPRRLIPDWTYCAGTRANPFLTSYIPGASNLRS